jgi:hypothetical protein
VTRRKPFMQEHIAERETWPESLAGRFGPEAYEKALENRAKRFGPKVYEQLRILTNKQRRELARLAQATPEQKKQFIDEVAGVINHYRLRKRVAAQETPAAITESMRQLIELIEQVVAKANALPAWIVMEVFDGIGIAPSADGILRAKEKVKQWEQEIKGHRPKQYTELLSKHAWTLQKVAGSYSSFLPQTGTQ